MTVSADTYRIEREAEDRGAIQRSLQSLMGDIGQLQRDVRLLMLVSIPAALVALVVALIALILVVQIALTRPASATYAAPPLTRSLASLDQRPGASLLWSHADAPIAPRAHLHADRAGSAAPDPAAARPPLEV
jgi:hypothetical protein